MPKSPIIKLTHDYYRAVKAATSCVVPRCREREIQFHHVVPEEKTAAIASIARHGTLQELITELQKCVPVCDAHHKAIHSGRLKGWLVGRFNNGTPTWDDSEARRFMPFRPFFTGLPGLRDLDRAA